MVGVMLRRKKIRKTSIKSIGCVRYYSLSSVDCPLPHLSELIVNTFMDGFSIFLMQCLNVFDLGLQKLFLCCQLGLTDFLCLRQNGSTQQAKKKPS